MPFSSGRFVAPPSLVVYPWPQTAGELTEDPTLYEAASDTTSSDTFEIMLSTVIQGAETLRSLGLVLCWNSQITTGSGVGSSKWMYAPGSSPTWPDDYVDLTDDVAASTTKTDHARSGMMKLSGMLNLPITLALVGKIVTGGDVLTCKIYCNTYAQVVPA
jgi:hypothetical protein